MHIKFNNTIITDTFEEIPANELVEGVQIITFDSDTDYYSELKVDATKTMTFTGRTFGKVLCLQGVINTPCHDWTDRNGEIVILGTSYNQKEFGQLLVEFDNQLIEVMYDEEFRKLEYYNINPNPDDEDGKQMIMLAQIHDNIFNAYNNHDILYNQCKALDEEESTYHFLSIPFDQDNCVVFIYEHALNIDKKFWRVHKHTWVMSRNYQAVELWENMNEILEKFSKTCVGKNENFIQFTTEERFVAQYDMKNFLDDEEDSAIAFARITEVFKTLRPNLPIANLFKPFYVNNDLDFIGYIAGYKDFNSGFYFICKGEYLTERKIKGKENEQELADEMRIAEAMFAFFERNKNGINPIDGQYYKGGELALSKDADYLYRDADAMLVKSDWQATAYIRIQKYWLKANDRNARDKELVQAMYDRKAMMERLLKAK